jgi:DNA-binding NarL/FixJ family response regulator
VRRRPRTQTPPLFRQDCHELEVADLVTEGLANHAIARRSPVALGR